MNPDALVPDRRFQRAAIDQQGGCIALCQVGKRGAFLKQPYFRKWSRWSGSMRNSMARAPILYVSVPETAPDELGSDV
jgi:hypothetical protein